MDSLLIILIVALVLVLMWRGPKTLPKFGEALGRGVREAKTEAIKAQAEIQARASGEPKPGSEATPAPTAPVGPPPGPSTPADTERPA